MAAVPSSPIQGVYPYLLYEVCTWFMALAEPNNAQAGLVSVVVGAGAAWLDHM